METQIETFEIDEAPTNMDDMAEFKSLIAELNLNGQKKLVSGEKKNVNPFRKMTTEEYGIYRVYLPDHCSIENYDSSAIPLRVLQVLKKAKELDFFDSFQIWRSPEDPLLLGKKGSEEYMIARWGEALESFETIKAKVCKKWRERFQELINGSDASLLQAMRYSSI